MDDFDVFVLQSESETAKNENIDQNKKNEEKITVSLPKKKKHHHHHHHHHHKSKSKSKANSEEKEKVKPAISVPVIQKETFCINNIPKEEDENYIVNFKFELSDSAEVTDEKQQTQLPPTNSNSPQKQILNTPKQVQNIETPKTEIKASVIPMSDIQPIEKTKTKDTTQIDEPDKKVVNIPKVVIEKKENITIQTPKRIQLTTNKKATNSMFEYKILNFLDQSLNHLSQDFLEDFQYYVQDAFSYDKIFDEFISSLNSEILEIFHDSNIKKEKEIRFIDNIDSITEKISKGIPHLPKNDSKSLPLEESETIEISEFLRIQEKLLSAHQQFNEIQSCVSEDSNLQFEDEIKSQYDQLKNAQLKRIELESISEIQTERLNRLEEQLKEIQEWKELNMKKKFNSNFGDYSNGFLKNSMKNLIADLQNRNLDENKFNNTLSLDKFKKSLNNYMVSRDQISYDIDYFGNYTEKSFCPIFSQVNHLQPFQLLNSHRKENIISE